MHLFAITLTLLTLALPSTGAEQQTPANDEQSSAQPTQPSTSVTVLENHYSPAEQRTATHEESQRWPPPWWSPFWSNWAFVLVGVGTAIAAIKTLYAIRDQAKSTRDTAEAALLNAKAIINAERAWVDILLVSKRSMLDCGFLAVNLGRTPAHLIALKLEQRCFSRENPITKPPEYGHIPINLLIGHGPPPTEINAVDIERELPNDWMDILDGKKSFDFRGYVGI